MTARKKPGPRVVKARTAKQRAASKKYGGFREAPTFVEANPPTSSWWVGKSREQLQEAAAEQQKRISWSRHGRLTDGAAAHHI